VFVLVLYYFRDILCSCKSVRQRLKVYSVVQNSAFHISHTILLVYRCLVLLQGMTKNSLA